MDVDRSEHERVLEERMARVEARLDRLEGAVPAQRIATPPSMSYVAASPPPRAEAPSIVRPAWMVTGTVGRVTAPGSGAGSGAAPVSGATHDDFPPRRSTTPQTSFRRPSFLNVSMPDLSGSLSEIEERLAGRALAWVGGLALVLGAIFFLSLAFSRGWIGEELRVVIGLVAGSAALAAGAAFMERGNRLLGHVLTPVGLAVISISLVAATRLFGIVAVEVGLLGALISAVAAAMIAVRANSQIVATFGLISVLIAPPLMGATPDLVTLLFVAMVLVGTTGIALWRSWSWLPPVAFILSVPQAASWVVGEPELAFGLIGIAVYGSLNIVAAGGEAFRRRRDDLSASSATLLLASAAFLVWAGFSLLNGDHATYRGLFLVLVALAHVAVGGFFVVRDGERNLFGLLALGSGIAALTMAAPVQLGAPAVPLAWTAEAVALAWLAVRRGHPYSALVSGVLFALAGTYLMGIYVDFDPPTSGFAFANPEGASLGFFAAGTALGVWLARDRSLRSALAAFGLVTVAVCASQALVPVPLAIALTLLLITGTAVWRALPVLPSATITWQTEGLIPRAVQHISGWRPSTEALLPGATALLGLEATVIVVGSVYGFEAGGVVPGTPFVSLAGLALTVYLVGLVAVAWISGRSQLREPLAAAGLLVTAWACATEFDGVALVAAWSILTVLGVEIWRTLPLLPHGPPIILDPTHPSRTLALVLPLAALCVGAAAAAHVLSVELPLIRFARVTPPTIPFTDAGAVSALILIGAALATGALVGGMAARRGSILLAGGIVAYTTPFEVYPWAVAVVWAGLGLLAVVMLRLDAHGRGAFLPAAIGIVVGAGLVAIGAVAPPSRLVVGTGPLPPIALLESIAALGAVVVGVLAIARAGAGREWARWVRAIGGALSVYTMSIAAVGIVATQVGGAIGTEELRTQGQVTLSVLWAVLGLLAFVAGLRLAAADLRHAGLALLALATAKVFLFDLSALDVAYRVISLIALGLLLLASAWVWQRLQHRPRPGNGHVGT